ncbi:hypothetical protein TZ03_20445 [Pseudomonas sp. 10-1B]|nr:hypothetical protein TZ03_20445 [Pseudomonas sp. 10-1B]
MIFMVNLLNSAVGLFFRRDLAVRPIRRLRFRLRLGGGFAKVVLHLVDIRVGMVRVDHGLAPEKMGFQGIRLCRRENCSIRFGGYASRANALAFGTVLALRQTNQTFARRHALLKIPHSLEEQTMKHTDGKTGDKVPRPI